MNLKIYNSRTQKKEIFTPLKEPEVRMYCCGPTVYDFLHVGNFRGAVFYNFVFNWLEKLGYKVIYAYNFTDVDDKILNRAREEGVSSQTIANRFIDEFWKDFNALKLSPHTHNPRVTEHMDSIIDLIGKIIDRGRAYVVEGEVFYAIDKFKAYGKLSHQNPGDMQSGSRIKVDPKKKNPLDFSLWKPAKEGEDCWPSPWGEGRPGWHIECSAMTRSLFGEQIDIHGGGRDLIFPHHENEIAQSEGASDKEYVGYWMHNNMFTFGGTKMSKSLGNIRRMRDFLGKFNGEIFKYMVLSVHYRSEADFTDTTIHNAIAALGRIYSALNKAWKYRSSTKYNDSNDSFRETLVKEVTSKIKKMSEQVKKAQEACKGFFNDDFSTPQAMAELFDTIRVYNQLVPIGTGKNREVELLSDLFSCFILDFGKPMALFQEEPPNFLKTLDDMLLEEKKISRSEVDALVSARGMARKEKDYKESDRLRDELVQWGVELQDTPDGTTWEVRKGQC